MTLITDDGAVKQGTKLEDSVLILAPSFEYHGLEGDDWIIANYVRDFQAGEEIQAYSDLYGDAGNDVILATVVNTGPGVTDPDNNLYGGYIEARPDLYGGDGDDTLSFTGTYDRAYTDVGLHGGAGNDAIHVSVMAHERSTYIETYARVDAGNGDDRVVGDIYGTELASAKFNLGAGDDTAKIRAMANDDANVTVEAGSGNDRVYASTTYASDAQIYLYGGDGDDYLSSVGGTDNLLAGNQGADTLFGSDNSDRLIGGQGDDYLLGFGGEDIFEFQSVRAREADRIADFTVAEDVIDVSRIDANVWRGGNQAFRFDESGSGGTGRLWVEDNPDSQGSLLYADTGRAILTVALLDGRGVDASDYGAGDFIL